MLDLKKDLFERFKVTTSAEAIKFHLDMLIYIYIYIYICTERDMNQNEAILQKIKQKDANLQTLYWMP